MIALEAFGWTGSGRAVSDVAGPFLDWARVQRERLSRLEAACRANQVDAILVSGPANVLFCTNWPRYRHSIHEGAYTALVCFTRPHVTVFASEGDGTLVREDDTFADIRILPPWRGAWAPVLLEALRDLELSNARLALDKAARDAVGDQLAAALPSAQFSSADAILSACRTIKSAAELEAFKHTLGVVEEGINLAVELAREGAFHYSEIELAAEANYLLLRRGCNNVDIWCASGPRGAAPRRYPSHRRIRPAEFVVIDGGGVLNGYRCEFARTVWTGGEPTKLQRDIYAAVWKSLCAGQRAMHVGASTADIERACLEPIEAAGLLEFYGGYPYTGHGIGFGPEPPYITARFPALEARLEAGMIVNLEPALWVPGAGGVRVEDTFAITQSGAERLSTAPYEDLFIDE